MSKTAKGAIVFDLDGTLIDSAPDLHAALNKVLTEEGAELVSLTETIGFIGHGIPNLVRTALAYRGLGADRLEPMTASMFRHYLASPSALTQIYPGVIAALTRLNEMGHPLGLCTNKALAPTLDILKALDLNRFFDVVIGGDSLTEKKPHPAPLQAAFAKLGTPLLYVGDSEVDAETAKAAEIPFALYTQGYRKTPVEALPHRVAFDHFGALLPEIAAMEQARETA
ncbi:phosphoglycolate phosphatase [Thioclava sp. FR2]|uniref:phosphoglycolate phosphatase n=1 Tax=Thioclava sp. FR2 TaxID=3445780 RepID=UPI003EBE8A79